MTFALVEQADGITATVPALVIAGRPLVFVLTSRGAGAQDLDTLRCRWRIERENAPVWGESEPAEIDLTHDSVRTGDRRGASERTFTVQTLPHWSGVLVLTILTATSNRPIVVAVQIVSSEELAGLTREFRTLRRTTLRLAGPMQGDEVFSVPQVLREAAASAAKASELLGPQITYVVRPHQESLAVMGGFEQKTGSRLVGSPSVLRDDVASIISTMRERIINPAPFRVAYQILHRQGLRGPPAGPVLFIEFSVPATPKADHPVTLGLGENLAEAVEVADDWRFEVTYQRKRIVVVGRIGPFRWPSTSDQVPLPV